MSYIVEKFVDYLSFTTHQAGYRLQGLEKQWRYIKSPIPNYNTAIMWQSGLIELWHTSQPKLGVHHIASGSCLKYIRTKMFNERELLRRVLEFAQISRIDIAITSMREDYSEHELQPSHIVDLCASGGLRSRMKPSKEVALNHRTETKYIGNQKTRRRLFRAYDKGLEDGNEAARIIRYELETRRGGNVIGRAVRDGTDIGALMRRYVDFPNSDKWLEITGAETATIKHETGEIEIDALERDRLERIAKWEWLNESIAPMVRRLIAQNSSIDDITHYENEHIAEFMRLSGLK